MKKRILLLLILFGVIVPPVFSQKEKDVSGWVTTDLVMNHKQWNYTASLEFRSRDNIRAMDLLSMGLYGRYTFSSFFKVSAGYEIFLTKTRNRGNIVEHRLMLQNESSFQIMGIKMDNRLSLLDDFENMDNPNFGFRDRFRVKYPIKRFEPFTYIELYYRFRDERVIHHKNRYGIGMNYNADSRNVISCYYMREQYSQRTFANNVFGISYAMTISI